MIHFQPEQTGQAAPYADAVNRLRSVRKALGLVEMFEGRPKRDLDDITFEALLPLASPAQQACADQRAIGAAGAAAAGIEALIGADGAGETTHPAALQVLGETLRRDLAGIEALFAGRA
ncbi:hypothetical protein GGQ97_000150 [Sphingomonas kaistensis]|uniref:Uncharacterized protein n=1 Tax=Sphingomonas kaistensis TaxID=298708 RepID=A0A7X6BFV4_9SPHN|nr:hypothetical protein [Sphingomonas kaistensis]NJC04357.1 hypothetical protein [Sphingomonas kaistensis]